MVVKVSKLDTVATLEAGPLGHCSDNKLPVVYILVFIKVFDTSLIDLHVNTDAWRLRDEHFTPDALRVEIAKHCRRLEDGTTSTLARKRQSVRLCCPELDAATNPLRERVEPPNNGTLVDVDGLRLAKCPKVPGFDQHLAELDWFEKHGLLHGLIGRYGATPRFADSSRRDDILQRQVSDDVAEQLVGGQNRVSGSVPFRGWCFGGLLYSVAKGNSINQRRDHGGKIVGDGETVGHRKLVGG